MTATRTAGDQVRPDGAARGFRPDVEGLRAVAVLLVVTYHAGIAWLPGGFVGVDVFFVISGFLITGLLVDELSRTSTVSLRRFWARRARRLLPAAAVVLVTTCVLGWFFLPSVQNIDTGVDVAAAATYVANWRFGAAAVDYLAAQDAPSPAQHFWSLSVEEQFYVAWPLLLLLVGFVVVRRRPHQLRQWAFAALLLLAAVSLWWSWSQTQSAPGWAYFSSLTRAWELAAGGLLAVATPWIRRMSTQRGTLLAAPLGVIGIAAIAYSALRFTQDTPFPGVAAALPTLGAVAVLAAGTLTIATPVGAVLSTPLALHLGGLSYSLYLWHWPLLIVAGAIVDDLSWWQGVLVIALVAYPLSYATHRWVENPFRHSEILVRKPSRAAVLALVCSGGAVVAGLLLTAASSRAADEPGPTGPVLGAGALVTEAPLVAPSAARPESSATATPTAALPPVPDTSDGITPSPAKAKADLPVTYSDGCHRSIPDTAVDGCVYGDLTGARTVALFGDSHAAQWFPGLAKAATDNRWKLVSLTKSGCPSADGLRWAPTLKREYTECSQWYASAVARLKAERPDLVVLSNRNDLEFVVDGKRIAPPASFPEFRRAFEATVRDLRDAGLNVLVLRDDPHPPKDIPTCVAKSLERLSACAFDRATALALSGGDVAAAQAVAGTKIADLTDAICPRPDVCEAVVGGVLVYRDDDHLTATYARTLAPRLAATVKAALS